MALEQEARTQPFAEFVRRDEDGRLWLLDPVVTEFPDIDTDTVIYLCLCTEKATPSSLCDFAGVDGHGCPAASTY